MNRYRKAIIDTNVLIAAKARDGHQVTSNCQLTTARSLREMQGNGTIAIDDRWLILQEYQNNVNPSGQPKVGDAFLRWIFYSSSESPTQ